MNRLMLCWTFVVSYYTRTHALKRSRTLALLHSALCTVFAATVLNATAQSDINRFIWDQANTQMIHAEAPIDYLKAARSYNRLIKDGIVNAPLLTNLGTALTMAGATDNASIAFERAERYSGTTPEIRSGFIAALARQKESTEVELTWYRTAFFWHYQIPAHRRIIIALSGWSLLWGGTLLYLLRKRYLSNPLQFIQTLSESCMITGALIFLIFSASSIFTLFQEKQCQSQWHSIQFSTTDTVDMEEQP